ncbi:MAG: thioredoxin domain-containing protein [Alphaproteobacteria bacterium]
MSGNLLGKEVSPYLLQHKDNPVHWRPWGEAALASAREEDKPILLSIGYSACHWCHVMAHESFEDPETAALMNELFVSIKVDREERPDLDAIYQLALALTGQQGGWPLTMFLTAKGEPFWGGTYFPPGPRFGRPGFRDVLRSVADTYRDQPDKVSANIAALREALEAQSRNKPGRGIAPETVDEGTRRLLCEVDWRFGGIGQAPKFPVTPMLELLWRRYRRSGDEQMREAVRLSVGRMCMGGIYDHLGGGFARYATDQRWLIPHFEKMLYDNAELLGLMTHLWQDEPNPLFAARIEETADWVLREMVAEGGGFASALDADSEGEEGKYYVWSEAEIDSLLGAESEFFKRTYDVTADGNWEGTNILNRLGQNELGDDQTEAKLADSRRVLLSRRATRTRPSWNDSVLADWNGLMIASLANAGAVFERSAWLEGALRAYDFVVSQMSADGRLRHSARHGHVKPGEFLDDYANMARAALILFELTGDERLLAQAREWVAVAERHYWDEAGGGYVYTPDDGETLITRTKTARDQATPAGNAIMVEALARLFHLTGEDAYRARAEEVIDAFAGEVSSNFPAHATLANASERLAQATQIVVMGERDANDTRALLKSVLETSLPNRILAVLPPGRTLPHAHPASGKTVIDGKATAYVCVGTLCSLPITEPEVLKAKLAAPHALD